MRKGQAIIQFFIPVLLVIGIDVIFHITFGGYFLLCAIALLASLKRAHYAGWGIMVTASIAVTLNYLRPTNSEFFNTAHHVIALKGVTSDHEIVLVNSDKPEKALFDDKSYDGIIIVKSNDDGNGCIMDYNMMSQPIFVYEKNVEDHNKTNFFRLANRDLLPHFENSVLFARSKDSLLVNIKTQEKSINIRMTLYYNGKQKTDTSSFSKIIKKGYPLADIIRLGIHRDSLAKERDYAELLEGVSIVRDSVGNNSDEHPLWYVTRVC